jgi:hypothetical protein
MKRYLSHRVVVNGKPYEGLSIATINDDNTVTVEPYTHEVHSTVYVNGPVIITINPNNSNDITVSLNNQ